MILLFGFLSLASQKSDVRSMSGREYIDYLVGSVDFHKTRIGILLKM